MVSRPPLDISPPPSPRPALALAQSGWRPRLPRPKHAQLWGVGVGSFALGLVNGALVVSAGIALVAYQQLLQLSPRQREGLMQRLQRGLPLPRSPQQQALVLALVTGASTYTFTSLWHSTHSLLMAGLLTGQGALALFALGALLRSSRAEDRSSRWSDAPTDSVDHNLAILSHSDPLKRLVAVRRLVKLAEQNAGGYGAGVSVRSHLIDCFTLMLSQEPEPIVRSALGEGLTLLQPAQALAPSSAAPFTVTTPEAVPAPGPETIPAAAPEAVPAAAPERTPERTPEAGQEISKASLAAAPPASTRPTSPGRRTAVEYVEYLDI